MILKLSAEVKSIKKFILNNIFINRVNNHSLLNFAIESSIIYFHVSDVQSLT